jgi:hypothetical protein
MNGFFLRLSTLSAGMALGFVADNLPAHSSVIQYSWSGRLVPSDAESEDPWQIGPQGQPFELSIAVSREASDLLELNVEFAAFEVSAARLLLNGQEVPFVDPGILDFTDYHAGLFDLLLFNGVFERFGHAVEIGSNLALPFNTFQFDEFIEAPPLFGSTVSAAQSAYGPQGPYTGIADAGVAVLVVPEPGSIALLSTLGLLPLIARRAKYICAWNRRKRRARIASFD